MHWDSKGRRGKQLNGIGNAGECWAYLGEWGRKNNKDVWIRINRKCVDIERQNVEVMIRDKSSLTLNIS
jgi:hypothetical protein